jgi:hypothetical protein
MMEELRKLFKRYEENGKVAFIYMKQRYIGERFECSLRKSVSMQVVSLSGSAYTQNPYFVHKSVG